MPFRSTRKMLAERSRKARQAHNERSALFLNLPAELRNYVYEILLSKDQFILQYRLFREEKSTFDRFADSRHVWNRNGRWYSQIGLPALSRMCRQMRREFMPLLFAAATGSVHVNVPNVQKTTFGNKQNFVDVFEDWAVTALQRIEIRSDYRCFGTYHNVGYAGPKRCVTLDSVKVVIDRMDERADLISISRVGDELFRKECCRRSSTEAAERLMSVINSLKLHEKRHKLCKEDFRKLSQQMDANAFSQSTVDSISNRLSWASLRSGRAS